MTKDAELCKIPITAEDIRDTMTSCAREESTGLDGLPFGVYIIRQACSGISWKMSTAIGTITVEYSVLWAVAWWYC